MIFEFKFKRILHQKMYVQYCIQVLLRGIWSGICIGSDRCYLPCFSTYPSYLLLRHVSAGRPVAVEIVVPRNKYKILSSKKAAEDLSSKKASSGKSDADEEEDVCSDSDTKHDEDAESSSEGVESASSDGEGASSDGEGTSSDGEVASSDGEVASSDGEDDSSDGGVCDDGESEDEGSGGGDSSDQSDPEEQPKKILREDAKDGKTLFIR